MQQIAQDEVEKSVVAQLQDMGLSIPDWLGDFIKKRKDSICTEYKDEGFGSLSEFLTTKVTQEVVEKLTQEGALAGDPHVPISCPGQNKVEALYCDLVTKHLSSNFVVKGVNPSKNVQRKIKGFVKRIVDASAPGQDQKEFLQHEAFRNWEQRAENIVECLLALPESECDEEIAKLEKMRKHKNVELSDSLYASQFRLGTMNSPPKPASKTDTPAMQSSREQMSCSTKATPSQTTSQRRMKKPRECDSEDVAGPSCRLDGDVEMHSTERNASRQEGTMNGPPKPASKTDTRAMQSSKEQMSCSTKATPSQTTSQRRMKKPRECDSEDVAGPSCRLDGDVEMHSTERNASRQETPRHAKRIKTSDGKCSSGVSSKQDFLHKETVSSYVQRPQRDWQRQRERTAFLGISNPDNSHAYDACFINVCEKKKPKKGGEKKEPARKLPPLPPIPHPMPRAPPSGPLHNLTVSTTWEGNTPGSLDRAIEPKIKNELFDD